MKKNLWQLCRRHRFLTAALGLLLLIALLAEGVTLCAAQIFNYEMSRQHLLTGSVTAERIHANLDGHVVFENLVWRDEADNVVLFIPTGSLEVHPLDVLTGRISRDTIESITLEDAIISLRLRDDPQKKRVVVDFVTPSDEFMELMAKESKKKPRGPRLSPEERKARAEKARAARERQLAEQWQSFDLKGKRLKTRLVFKHCRVEVLYSKRHYLLRSVQLDAKLDTKGLCRLDFTTGGFGGTMVGRGISLHGTVDCGDDPVPTLNLSILANDVDPSSLGFGGDLHDKMTLTANFTGPFLQPHGTGTVSIPTLTMPGLAFTNVHGTVDYQGSKLSFTNVTANVYGGNFAARGSYDLDSRAYELTGHGENLSTYIALPGEHLHTQVALDITVKSGGTSQNTVYYGSFQSGPGKFHGFPFDGLSGKFRNYYHTLEFYDADIAFGDMHIHTPFLKVKDKKLTLDPITIRNADGDIVFTYTPPEKNRAAGSEDAPPAE